MTTIKNRIILSLFIATLFLGQSAIFAEDLTIEGLDKIKILEPAKNPANQNKIKGNYFDLANVMDSFLNTANTNQQEVETNLEDKKAIIRKNFIDTTLKFNQGNASVAYDEYMNLIEKIDNDTALLILSKVFYEIGFYSLAETAIDKIVYKNQYYDNIADLKKSYATKVTLTKEEEISFAKMYSDIYFNNSAIEVINELTKEKRAIYKTNDCIDFMLSRAYLENKKYDDALNFINKAITVNPTNVNYQMFKLDILRSAKKYKEASKLALKMKKTKLPVNFINDFEIKYVEILANVSKSETDKKYYGSKKSYLEGNYEKTKKDCKSILNFDKDNDKIITLFAKSELALGRIEKANSYFVNSYKINKKNPETLTGLGDIKYLHGDYKNSVKSYKKALKLDNGNYEILIKLTCAHRQYGKKQKELNKLEQIIDEMPSVAYTDYYNSAISLAQKNDILKEEFLKRALNVNPMDERATGELIELYLKNKSFNLAKNLIYNLSFTLGKNYYYYYLCGLYNEAINKKKDAIQLYKTSLKLNPNFEVANVKLLNLIPETTQEEI